MRMTTICHSEAMEGKKITVEGIMTNMAYACAFAAERIMYVLDRRLRARGGRLKHEKKQAFTRLSETLKAAKRYYDMAFDEDLIAAAENSGDMLDYDRAHHDGNEIARLRSIEGFLHEEMTDYGKNHLQERMRWPEQVGLHRRN